MEIANIAASSISLNMAKVEMSAGISVAKKALDSQEQAAQGLLEMLPPVAGLGEIIDVQA